MLKGGRSTIVDDPGKGARVTFISKQLGLCTAALVAALTSGPAVADERSALLTAQGILLLDEGRHTEARKTFAAALAADSTDEDARYYLAHSAILSGDFQGALDTLGSAGFESWDADYLRGLALMNLQESPKAIGAFRSSIQKHRNSRSSFYAALLYHRAGQTESARKLFESTRNLDADLEPYRVYYLGLIAEEAGDSEAARGRWQEVRERHPGSPAADLAAAMLGEESSSPEGGVRFLFSTQLLGQYDTNPGLVQSDADLARVYHPDLSDSTGAMRTATQLAVGLGFGGKEGFVGRLGLAGYGSIHFGNEAAEAFNVLQPGAFLELGWAATNWRLAVPVRYAVTFLGTDIARYNNTLSTGIRAGIGLTDKLGLRTGLLVDAQNFGEDAARNGLGIGVPLELHAAVHDKVRVRGGYTFSLYGTEDDASEWSFTGHRIGLGSDVMPLAGLTLFAEGGVYLRGYDNAFNVPGVGPTERNDTEIGVGLGARYAIVDGLSVQLSWDGTFQSSIDLFTYNRNIATLALSYTY